LGGVQYYRGEYRDALGNLQPAASQVRTSPSVLAGFWLALCQQELGSSEEAQQAYRQALRNWKGLPALPADEEALLHSLWQSARSALGESASLAHR
jgi:TolA-binding protein